MAYKPRRFCTLGIAAVLLLATASMIGSPVFSGTQKSAYAADNNWFLGEGAQKDMYVIYRVSFFDLNDGRTFEMMIHFKDQDEKGNWIAPAYIIDGTTVLQGELRLSALDLTVLGGSSKFPPEMSDYIGAYTSTLKWLSAYVPRPGQSLTSASWGKIGSIGGSEIKPAGSEKVSFPGAPDVCGANTCETTLIQYHKSVDNKIWVLNEFPYPVKALTYVDITTGNPPKQYEFELLLKGSGAPPAPTGVEVIPKPPLTKDTGRGTYKITLSWEPESIEAGKTTDFAVRFAEGNGFPLDQVNYDLTIRDGSSTVIEEFKNKNTEATGIGSHTVNLNKTGSLKVTVVMNSISGAKPSGDFVESADFGIAVVPEFPAGIVAIVATSIGAIAIVARFRRPLFGQAF